VRPDWTLRDAWPYGDLYVLEQLWARLGMPERLTALAQDTPRRTLPVERACFAMVANRCCAPASKLYCFEQWLREDVRLAGGTPGAPPPVPGDGLLRGPQGALEQELFFRVADLFSCDVELIFYDTTTLHCEIDGRMPAGSRTPRCQGSALAGAQTYPALRQRGKAKNKRSDVPQVIVGLAMTRDGLPVRSWVFRGDTVDVETVAQVKADLRGWKLTRSVFVGRRRHGLRGEPPGPGRGRRQVHPLHAGEAGNEVSEAVLTRPAGTAPSPPTSKSRKSSSGTGSAAGATWSATTPRRPSGSRPTGTRSWPNSRPSCPTCAAGRGAQQAGLRPPHQRAVREVPDPGSARPPEARPRQDPAGRAAATASSSCTRTTTP
jgi:hypothetical protein